ncbi:MAG: Clp1/GlmU family protein [Promethearchaeota archaeon]
MIREVEKGHTLLVKGPTRVTLLNGKLEIFGKLITPPKERTKEGEEEREYHEEKGVLIIPAGTSYPLYCVEKCKFEIFSSNLDENLMEVDENTISDSWIEIKDKILSFIKKNTDKKPIKIMVLGISSGKTTILKYLANNFLREGLKGGYLDTDLGQQFIYIPTTINIGEISEPLVSGDNIHPEETIFIGATFPKGNFKFILPKESKNLIEKFKQNHEDADFILIDTDGWIKTENGIIYKNFFIKTVDPDIIIVFYDETVEELIKIVEEASQKKERKIFKITELNKYYFEKNKDERRFIRQSLFSKHFASFRKIVLPLDDIKFVKKEYDKEKDEIIEIELDLEELIKLPYHYVITALLTENSELINMALLFNINAEPEKSYILIYSDIPYKEQVKIKKILIGSLRLSTKGNHQGYLYL